MSYSEYLPKHERPVMSICEMFFHHNIDIASELYSDGAEVQHCEPENTALLDKISDELEVIEGRMDVMYAVLNAAEPDVYII